jgi:hypothetical protein
MRHHGYSFIEFLIALGFVSITIVSVSTATLQAQHHLAATNQTLCAAQILSNIEQELLGSKNNASAAQQNYWHTQAAKWLPGATVHINHAHIEIHWPADTPIISHCEAIENGYSCLGMDIQGSNFICIRSEKCC